MSVHSVGESLRIIREEHNFKQREIAEALGIDRSTYSFYETGKTRPSLDNVFALAKIYNVTVGQLLGVEQGVKAEAKKHPDRVAADIDPIAFLSKQEQLMLMYFRLADEEKKQEILNLINPNNNNNK